MSEQTAEKISVQCACGKRLKAPPSAVGKKAKCPACGNVLTITAPPPATEDDSLNALYDLAEQSDEAAKKPSSAYDDSTRCPQCMTAMPPGSVLCTSCGYDTRTGKKLATTRTKRTVEPIHPLDFGVADRKSQRKDKMAPQGKLMVGVAASVGLALAASIPWFLVTYFTDRDFYILELLIGLGAGLGMQIGQKGYSKLGGALAAGITCVTLIVVRVLVIVAVLMPVIRKAATLASDLDDEGGPHRNPAIARMLADQELASQGANPDAIGADEASLKRYIAALKRAGERVKKMSDSEYEAALVKAQQKEVRDELIAGQLDTQLRKMGVNPDFQKVEHDTIVKARKQLAAQVDAMTPDQQKAQLKKVNAEFEAKMQKELAELREKAAKPSDSSDSGSGIGSSAPLGVLLLLFGILPLLFMLLAMAAAYQTAAGTVKG